MDTLTENFLRSRLGEYGEMTILYYILLPKTCIVIMNEITKLCKTVLTQIITLIKLTLDLCSSRTDGKIMFEVYHRGARKKKTIKCALA